MDISKFDKADVLRLLYNSSKQQGMGMLHFKAEDMTKKQAQALLDSSRDKYFDYLQGRVMKTDLSGNDLRTALYNRDNGPDAAERVLAVLDA